MSNEKTWLRTAVCSITCMHSMEQWSTVVAQQWCVLATGQGLLECLVISVSYSFFHCLSLIYHCVKQGVEPVWVWDTDIHRSYLDLFTMGQLESPIHLKRKADCLHLASPRIEPTTFLAYLPTQHLSPWLSAVYLTKTLELSIISKYHYNCLKTT